MLGIYARIRETDCRKLKRNKQGWQILQLLKIASTEGEKDI